MKVKVNKKNNPTNLFLKNSLNKKEKLLSSLLEIENILHKKDQPLFSNYFF